MTNDRLYAHFNRRVKEFAEKTQCQFVDNGGWYYTEFAVQHQGICYPLKDDSRWLRFQEPDTVPQLAREFINQVNQLSLWMEIKIVILQRYNEMRSVVCHSSEQPSFSDALHYPTLPIRKVHAFAFA